ncbi:MAG: class I SAM-dependent methyltransferase [Chitinophagaceae bacterium]|nr:class I SAM-dependent methyltransferase [Chitinophagaceae bacterium]
MNRCADEKDRPASRCFHSDNWFNALYPERIRLMAAQHWTPVNVARKASLFLAAENGVRVLDIGSGVGKFCLNAAYYSPKSHFYGVEQREDLVWYAQAAGDALGLKNVSFIHGNFTRLDIRRYDHIYFYNSFYENLAGADKIDERIAFSGELYNYYTRYLYKQLEQMPAGTRLATFYSLDDEVPEDYHVVGTEMDNLLKFWIKV